MSNAIVIAEEEPAQEGSRFAWGLAFAGGVAATAVTFFLLLLGAGFGLLLVHPTSSAPAFLAGGAIYFFVAQAFGFAVGGHLAGRLLAPEPESRAQTEFRAAAHGFVAWAVAILAMMAVVALAGLAAGAGGASAAALYGMSSSKTEAPAGLSAYFVDKLYRPASGGGEVGSDADTRARAEAARILEAGPMQGAAMARDDHDRLVALVATRTGLAPDAAASRVDQLQGTILTKERAIADSARIAASYTSLWLALSLLFGAVVASAAAVFAGEEVIREAATSGIPRYQPG